MDASSRGRRFLIAAERVAVAHVAGYPIAFLWAVAAIPLTIHLTSRTLDTFGDDLDRVGRYVVHRLAWPAGALFVLAHLAAIPWIVARDPRRGQRLTLGALAALAALGVLFGGASWIWLILR